MPRPKRVLVVGTGALGSLLAHDLATSFASPSYLAKTKLACSPQVLLSRRTPGADSFRVSLLTDRGEDLRAFPVCATRDAPAPIDVALVTVKNHKDLQTAANDLYESRSNPSTIVTLCNGLGAREVLARRFPTASVRAGVTYVGALIRERRSGNHVLVERTGKGPTVIERDPSAASSEETLDFLCAAMPDWRTVPDATALVWTKLLVNTVLNPLTALHDVLNGQINAPEHLSLVENLVSEFERVAQAKGVRLELGGRTGTGFVRGVAEATARNVSSMLADVRAGRETEIEALTGALVSCARELSVPVPTHETILERVRALERRRAAAEASPRIEARET